MNDLQIKRLKATDKKQTISDGGGLALIVNPLSRGGTKYFVYNYRFNGKQQSMRLGKYPDICLAEARQKHQQARNEVANGINPAAAKQTAKAAQKAALLNTFEHIARQWHTENIQRWQPDHAKRILRYFEQDIFPHIGNSQIDTIPVTEIKTLIDRKAKAGAANTAEKLRQWIGAVYQYAAMLEITDRNPAAVLQGYLKIPERQHMKALPPEELTEFYRRLLLSNTHQQNRIGILLIMLVFARNTEIRGGLWAEIDFEAKQWAIAGDRMKVKTKEPHIAPLSDWTLELLKELHALSGHTPYLFPSRNASKRGYISENTFGKIIHTMGYDVTPHGFRSLASSVLNEQGYNPDAIERQLAHEESNRIRAAYNRADYMAERREMMQWYSDYLRRHYNAAMEQIQGK